MTVLPFLKGLALSYVAVGIVSYIALSAIVLLRKYYEPSHVSPPRPSADGKQEDNEKTTKTRLANVKSVLIVTAHPDDECMFFGPTILGVRNANPAANVHVLCLTQGRDSPRVRTKEVVESCKLLGAKCTVVDSTELRDDPLAAWQPAVVAREIAKEIRAIHDDPKRTLDPKNRNAKSENLPDMIITFDMKGVSGHLNHRSVFFGAEHFLLQARKGEYSDLNKINGFQDYAENELDLFTLESSNIVRKYAGLGDTFLCLADHFNALSFQTKSYHRRMSKPDTPVSPKRAEGPPSFLYIRGKLAAFTFGDETTDSILFVNSVSDYFHVFNAMRKHRTQLVWFRYLFMLFSKYFWINRLQRKTFPAEESKKTK